MPGQGIAPAPGGLRQALGHPAAGTGAGFRRLSGGRLICTFRRLGFRQSRFRHITRISRRAAPYAWAQAAGFLACYCSLRFSDPGQPSDPETTPLISARWAGDTTTAPRGAAEPQRDDGGIDAGAEQGHCAAMAEYVRVQALGLQAGTGLRRGGCVNTEPALDRVAAEPPPGPGWEQRVVRRAASLGDPCPHHRLGLAGERDGALLAAFAFTADVAAGAQCDVAAVQAGELGDTQAGLQRQDDDRAVASPFPPRQVWGADKRLGLG